ncbi:phage antirepressor KilAC domain-containing protein [Cetobacterium sp.]|uniref:phage antirepressor KilAC domain-containing protein n=1 Tax=Cetobacterium sp. TaxID=2071632 RepID=UPI003F3637D8
MLNLVNTISLVNRLEEENIERILLKVGFLAFVKDIGVTKREVANYFGIGIRTIEKYLKENNKEFLKYGKTVFETKIFVTDEIVDYKISNKVRRLVLLNKKHILFLACLLANKSNIAKSVVKYLLELESKINDKIKSEALQIAFEGQYNEFELKNEIDRLKESLIKAKPLIEFAEVIKGTDSEISLNDFAKSTYLKFKIGRNTLFKLLRDQKILTGKNRPFHKYIIREYFVLKLRVINGQIKYQPLLTGKGQVWLFSIIQKIMRKYEGEL